MSSRKTARESSAAALADEAYALVQARPRAAAALAQRALELASAGGDTKAAVSARYALGWAQHVLGDPETGNATLRAGVRIARRSSDRRGEGLLRRQLALWLAIDGSGKAARREIDAALALLSGRDRAHSLVHRVEIHRRAHTVDPETHRRVCVEVAGALRVLRRDGEEIWEARLLFNRGLLHSDRGELDAAQADLRRAHALYERLGAEAAALDALVAIAEVHRLRGDVLACLAIVDGVQAALPPGHFNNNLEHARATALSQARLIPEARAAADAYVEHAKRRGYRDEVATTMLQLAAIALMALDLSTAERVAARVTRSFAAQGKPVNAALARTVWLRARLLRGNSGRSAVRSALAAADVLEHAGWRLAALRARVLVARLALAEGRQSTARRQLELARPLYRRGTATDRIELHHAKALLRAADGDRGGAERSLAAGLRLLGNYRAALGAVELRATASGIGSELSREGLRLAVHAQTPTKILSWAERLRASALELPVVRPPGDPALRALQGELRTVGARIRDAEETGTIPSGAAASRARLEAAIRARMRLVEGGYPANRSTTRAREAAAVLEDRTLIEYVALDGTLGALTLARGRLAFHELGADTATTELEWLRFALGRLARGGDAAQRTAARSNAEASAAALDRLLVQPLLPAIGTAPLVIVPTGALHALPWSALSSLRGRPVVVAPSLSVWLRLDGLPHARRRKVAFVAGPRLRHSAAEARELSALRPDSTVLHGKAATAKATLAALDGAALAHLACHGRFRSDSPLFSSVELADGPLNVYELQSLKRAPEVVVLSACDLALSDRHPGDELLGLAAALLGMGTRTIVASVVQAPDAEARRMMLAFHRNLAGGETPAAALAQAQARTAVPGFVCLGSG